jgi:hypothetical protein
MSKYNQAHRLTYHMALYDDLGLYTHLRDRYGLHINRAHCGSSMRKFRQIQKYTNIPTTVRVSSNRQQSNGTMYLTHDHIATAESITVADALMATSAGIFPGPYLGVKPPPSRLATPRNHRPPIGPSLACTPVIM